VVKLTDFRKLSITDITTYLKLLFTIEMKQAPAQLLEQMTRLQGRPHIFFTFVKLLYDSLSQEKCAKPSGLFELMLKTAQLSIKRSKDSFKSILDKYVAPSRVICDAIQVTTRQLVAQQFIAAVFNGQKEISISNDEVNADLVGKRLLMSQSHSGPQVYRLKDEPLFFEVLGELATHSPIDFVTEYFLSPFSVLDCKQDIKGRVTEYLLAWYFIKACRRKGPQSLYDLLYDIVAEGFTMRDDWSNVTVDTRQGWASNFKDDSEDFVGLVDHRDYSTLQHRTHQNLGPDMCFLVRVGQEEHMGAVVIPSWKLAQPSRVLVQGHLFYTVVSSGTR
jgi:hypothetical protein